jgi:dipeptidyl-peptidase-2
MQLACKQLVEAPTPLAGLAMAAGLFYNGTNGNLNCFDIETEFVECSDQTGCGTGPSMCSIVAFSQIGGQAWDYQACTEIIYFPNTNNGSDMFPPRNWTIADLTKHCHQTWGIVPDPDWLGIYTGGRYLYSPPLHAGSDLAGVSNIIFSNGLLDPWHGGGFLHTHSDTLVAVIIEDGAHHLDLRGSNPQDPQSVTTARKAEVALLKKWLNL